MLGKRLTLCRSKPVALSLKQGTVKLTQTSLNGTLFAKDKYSRSEFTISTADTTLNAVKKVEFKDAKYKDLLEIYAYGNGTYAIGFKGNRVPASLVGKTVTVNLNVYIEGNDSYFVGVSGKPNATVKLKLTVLK